MYKQLDPKTDKEQPLFEMQDEESEKDGEIIIATKMVASEASWELACGTWWFYYVKVSKKRKIKK